MSRQFRENKRIYWNEVNQKQKARDRIKMRIIKDSQGNVLTEPTAAKQRWSEYFEYLLNVFDRRRAQLN